MSKTIAGKSGATFVGRREGRNRETGPFYEDVWEGPTRDSVAGVLADYADVYEDQFIEPAGVKWRAVIRVNAAQENDPEVPIDGVRLVGNRLNQTIYGLPQFKNVTDESIRKIQAYEADPKSGVPTFTGSDSAQAQKLFDHIKLRITSKLIYAPMLIRTKTASSVYQFQISFAAVGRVFLPRDIAAEAQLTNILRFTLPTEESSMDGFRYGWLKHYPDVDSVAGGKTQFVQEYEWNLWSNELYPLA